MKTIYNFLLLLMLASLFLQCCKNKEEEKYCYDPTNPKCVNYDPCYGVKPPTAEFTIHEGLLGIDNWVKTPDDSVFLGRDIIFESPYKGSEFKHTWYLGAEVIHGSTFTRDHSSVLVSQRPTFITVSHVIEYTIDEECFPNLTRKDSVARTYYLIKYFNEFATIGNFRGVFINEKDSFDFSFLFLDANNNPSVVFSEINFLYSVNFHNLNPNDTTLLDFNFRNKILLLIGTGGAPRGSMEIDPRTGLFTMKYSINWVDYEVRGRKLE